MLMWPADIMPRLIFLALLSVLPSARCGLFLSPVGDETNVACIASRVINQIFRLVRFDYDSLFIIHGLEYLEHLKDELLELN